METYKKLTPPEKRACRKYIVQSFKRHNVKKINNKTITSIKVVELIKEFQIKFNKCPVLAFRERLKTKVSNKKGYVYVIGNLNENHKRVNEIAEMLKLHRDTVSYRIKELGIIATQKWWYDEYQIELIKDFERSPRTKYSIVESKINKL